MDERLGGLAAERVGTRSLRLNPNTATTRTRTEQEMEMDENLGLVCQNRAITMTIINTDT